MPGFRSFLRFFVSYCIGQISDFQINGIISMLMVDTGQKGTS